MVFHFHGNSKTMGFGSYLGERPSLQPALSRDQSLLMVGGGAEDIEGEPINNCYSRGARSKIDS